MEIRFGRSHRCLTFTSEATPIPTYSSVRTGWPPPERSRNVRLIESNEDTLLYSSGHMPGAVHVDWTSDLNDQIRRDYITREGFEQLMSRIGATPETTVVFYGDKNNWWACYAFWVFQLFGHTKAKIMDGGRIKWEKEGRPLTREVPSLPRSPRTRRRTALIPGTARFETTCLHTQQGKGQLVDVRSPEEYAGTRMHMPDYPNEGALRGGHIPGARSIPWARAINPEDGTFKSAAELQEDLLRRKTAVAVTADHCLLPHRGTQQPQLVRAEVPPRIRERAQLRRVVDRVGQHGECADREMIQAYPPQTPTASRNVRHVPRSRGSHGHAPQLFGSIP